MQDQDQGWVQEMHQEMFGPEAAARAARKAHRDERFELVGYIAGIVVLACAMAVLVAGTVLFVGWVASR